MSDVQQRAAEVPDSTLAVIHDAGYDGYAELPAGAAERIAAALAAAGLLVDDDTAKYVALGKALENQQAEYGPLWYFDAIYREAGVGAS